MPKKKASKARPSPKPAGRSKPAAKVALSPRKQAGTSKSKPPAKKAAVPASRAGSAGKAGAAQPKPKAVAAQQPVGAARKGAPAPAAPLAKGKVIPAKGAAPVGKNGAASGKTLPAKPKLPPLPYSKPVIGSMPPPPKVAPKRKVPALVSGDVERLRASLLHAKDRLEGAVTGMRSEALEKDEAVSHDSIADHGTDVFDQDITLSLVENKQGMIQSIDEALGKIADGTYGKCENCSVNIRKERLEALPFARLCLDCQEAQESGRA